VNGLQSCASLILRRKREGEKERNGESERERVCVRTGYCPARVCVCVYAYVCTYVCVCMCVYLCVCVFMFVCDCGEDSSRRSIFDSQVLFGTKMQDRRSLLLKDTGS